MDRDKMRVGMRIRYTNWSGSKVWHPGVIHDMTGDGTLEVFVLGDGQRKPVSRRHGDIELPELIGTTVRKERHGP